MNETMFSESEDEGQAAEHEAAAAHAKDFSDNLTQGLQDSTGVHMIHTGEQVSVLSGNQSIIVSDPKREVIRVIR